LFEKFAGHATKLPNPLRAVDGRVCDRSLFLHERSQSHILSYFQVSHMSGGRSVCQNPGCFNSSLLCVPAALREDLLIRRRIRA
jgi:hypothetical protein